MKRVKTEILKQHIKEHGLAKVSDETGISVHTLMRMQGENYASEPSATTRKALCRFFKVSEDTLFGNIEEAG